MRGERRYAHVYLSGTKNYQEPAILRRAAVKEEFLRPSEEERFDLFNLDLREFEFSKQGISELIDATGLHGKRNANWTYSDIRLRLYPTALAKAFPDKKLEIHHLLDSARELEPSPVMEDA